MKHTENKVDIHKIRYFGIDNNGDKCKQVTILSMILTAESYNLRILGLTSYLEAVEDEVPHFFYNVAVGIEIFQSRK